MRTQETQDFWRQVLERVDRPSAKKLADGLDLSQPLGYAVGSKDGKGGSALVRFMVSVKRTHPTKVLLVRVRARPACCSLTRWAAGAARDVQPVPGGCAGSMHTRTGCR